MHAERLGGRAEQRLVDQHDVFVGAERIPRVDRRELRLRLEDRRDFGDRRGPALLAAHVALGGHRKADIPTTRRE